MDYTLRNSQIVVEEYVRVRCRVILRMPFLEISLRQNGWILRSCYCLCLCRPRLRMLILTRDMMFALTLLDKVSAAGESVFPPNNMPHVSYLAILSGPFSLFPDTLGQWPGNR